MELEASNINYNKNLKQLNNIIKGEIKMIKFSLNELKAQQRIYIEDDRYDNVYVLDLSHEDNIEVRKEVSSYVLESLKNYNKDFEIELWAIEAQIFLVDTITNIPKIMDKKMSEFNKEEAIDVIRNPNRFFQKVLDETSRQIDDIFKELNLIQSMSEKQLKALPTKRKSKKQLLADMKRNEQQRKEKELAEKKAKEVQDKESELLAQLEEIKKAKEEMIITKDVE